MRFVRVKTGRGDAALGFLSRNFPLNLRFRGLSSVRQRAQLVKLKTVKQEQTTLAA
jgi:hypothetical protein